jgi:hypothetical protein
VTRALHGRRSQEGWHAAATRTRDGAPPSTTASAPATAIAAAALSAAALLAHPSPATAAAAASLPPILDRARLVPELAEGRLAARVADLEARTGWRVRLLTSFPDDAGAPDADALRAGWGLADPRSVAILADPSAPNMLRFFPGDAVLGKLPRRFFIELQARYGNLFERRKAGGEPEALAGALDALLACLDAPGGCATVPGLSDEQRALGLVTSAAGGFVLGFASRVTSVPLFPLYLAPLWAPLLVFYGIAPLVTRLPPGEAALPVALNLSAFAAAALIFRASPLFRRAGADREALTKEGQAKRMATEDEEDEGGGGGFL